MKKHLSALLALLAALAGAGVSRWEGSEYGSGGVKATAWGVLMASGYLTASGLSWTHAGIALFVLVACAAGKATGHGGGMDLGHSVKLPMAGRTVEVVEWPLFLICYEREGEGWTKRRLFSEYWYDFILMAIKGLATVLGGAIAFGILDWRAGVLVAVGGLACPLMYALGWKMFPSGAGKKFLGMNEATQIGEAGTGFFGTLFLALSVLICVGRAI